VRRRLASLLRTAFCLLFLTNSPAPPPFQQVVLQAAEEEEERRLRRLRHLRLAAQVAAKKMGRRPSAFDGDPRVPAAGPASTAASLIAMSAASNFKDGGEAVARERQNPGGAAPAPASTPSSAPRFSVKGAMAKPLAVGPEEGKPAAPMSLDDQVREREIARMESELGIPLTSPKMLGRDMGNGADVVQAKASMFAPPPKKQVVVRQSNAPGPGSSASPDGSDNSNNSNNAGNLPGSPMALRVAAGAAGGSDAGGGGGDGALASLRRVTGQLAAAKRPGDMSAAEAAAELAALQAVIASASQRMGLLMARKGD
jgi:hypothetical protein